jgi:hypothetical protein
MQMSKKSCTKTNGRSTQSELVMKQRSKKELEPTINVPLSATAIDTLANVLDIQRDFNSTELESRRVRGDERYSLRRYDKYLARLCRTLRAHEALLNAKRLIAESERLSHALTS